MNQHSRFPQQILIARLRLLVLASMAVLLLSGCRQAPVPEVGDDMPQEGAQASVAQAALTLHVKNMTQELDLF